MNTEGDDVHPHVERQPVRATIVARREIAQDTIEIILDLGAARFFFVAGQYIWLILPHLLFPDPKGKRRAFSIASSPRENNFTIVFRFSQSGFKKTLM